MNKRQAKKNHTREQQKRTYDRLSKKFVANTRHLLKRIQRMGYTASVLYLPDRSVKYEISNPASNAGEADTVVYTNASSMLQDIRRGGLWEMS